MDQSTLTTDTDTNITKETESSLSYEESKPSKKVDSNITKMYKEDSLNVINDNSEPDNKNNSYYSYFSKK